MLEKFKSIRFKTMSEATQCVVPDRGYSDLTLDSPAIAVLTDHRIEKAIISSQERTIERARRQMAEANVSMLLTSNEGEEITGLITSADISGEKAIQYISQNDKKHSDIKVKHLMTHLKDIPTLTIKDVLNAQIGDVLHTLNEIGSEYVLVTMEDGEQTVIRGVFSARSIARALKIFFDPSPAARTFAEFTKALHGSALTH